MGSLFTLLAHSTPGHPADGFYLYGAQASFAWLRVYLCILRGCEVCQIRSSSWESFISFCI